MEMKQIIQITGTMYEANLVAPSKDEAAQLIAGTDSNREPFRSMVRLQDQLFSSSIMSGYLVGDGPLYVTVGGGNTSISYSMQPHHNTVTINVLPFQEDVVVTEKVTRDADMMLEITEAFKFERLVWLAEKMTLPTNETRVVAMPQYDGQDFEFVQSYTDSVITYMLTVASERIDLFSTNY